MKILDLDKVLDQGGFSEDTVKYRSSLLKDLQDVNSIEALDIAQKLRFVDGEWLVDPCTFPRGCNVATESPSHFLFMCPLARHVRCKVLRWWEIDDHDYCSYDERLLWFNSIRMSSSLKGMFE
ncbi:hypothetical protein Tco_1148355, partial [Tanacetum coccineum]